MPLLGLRLLAIMLCSANICICCVYAPCWGLDWWQLLLFSTYVVIDGYFASGRQGKRGGSVVWLRVRWKYAV